MASLDLVSFLFRGGFGFLLDHDRGEKTFDSSSTYFLESASLAFYFFLSPVRPLEWVARKRMAVAIMSCSSRFFSSSRAG